MLWAVWCEDGKDVAQLRRESGPAHSKYLTESTIKVVMAGPLISDDGQSATGSLLIFESGSRAEVEAQMNADPFVISGVWTDIRIAVFKMSRENISRKEPA